jgi:hypothetical protein
MKYLTDRQEIARAMNFGRYPVIRIDMENHIPGYDGLFKGDPVKVMTPTSRYPDLYETGTLMYYDHAYYIRTDCACLSDDFGYQDVMDMLRIAQAPVIHAGDTVIIIEDHPKKRLCKVHMMKAGDRVDVNVSPCCTFEEID